MHSPISPRIAAFVSTVVDSRDLFFFAGIAAVCHGVALIHEPSAWIVGGTVFAALGLRR